MELEGIGEIYKELVKARLQMTQPLPPISSLDFISGSLLTTAVCMLHYTETDCSTTGQIPVHFCLVALFHAKLR